MSRIINNKFRWIFVGTAIVAVIVLIFVFLPSQAHAQSDPTTVADSIGCGGLYSFFTKPFTCIVGFISFGINYVFAFILGTFLSLATVILSFAISFSNGVLDPGQNSVVFVGWSIVRDIANLGFVLLLIVVAIATILRQKSYGYRNLLLKLIAAAILVNFSLTIAGFFVDFSNVLTNFFSSRIASNPLDIASGIAGAFGPQTLLGSSQGTSAAVDVVAEAAAIAFGGPLLRLITSLVFANVFLLTAIFTILVFAAMLILRYLWISFLVIIAPIVWLFWVIPDLSGNFSKWWSKFVQWVFFAPAGMFFVYLALYSMENLGSTKTLLADPTALATFGPASVLSDILSQGLKMILLVGLMLGGLIVAQKMGVGMAGASLKFASKVGKMTMGAAKSYTKERAIRGAGIIAGSETGQRITSGIRNAGEKMHAEGGTTTSGNALKRMFYTAIGGKMYRGASKASTFGATETYKAQERENIREMKRRDPGYVPPEEYQKSTLFSHLNEAREKTFKKKKKEGKKKTVTADDVGKEIDVVDEDD